MSLDEFKNKINNLYIAQKAVTGALESVDSFLNLPSYDTTDVANLYSSLDSEISNLANTNAKSIAQILFSAVAEQNLLFNSQTINDKIANITTPTIANFSSLTTYKITLYSDNACLNVLNPNNIESNTIDVTASKNPFDVMFAYLSCATGFYMHYGDLSLANDIYLKQNDQGDCMKIASTNDHISHAIAGCQYFLLNEAPPI